MRRVRAIAVAIVSVSFFFSFCILFLLQTRIARSIFFLVLDLPFGYYGLSVFSLLLASFLCDLFAKILYQKLVDTHHGQEGARKGPPSKDEAAIDFVRIKSILILVYCAGMLLLFIMNYSLSFFGTSCLLLILYFFPTHQCVQISMSKRQILFMNPLILVSLLHMAAFFDANVFLKQVIDAHLLGKWFLWALLPTFWATLINLQVTLSLLEMVSSTVDDAKVAKSD